MVGQEAYDIRARGPRHGRGTSDRECARIQGEAGRGRANSQYRDFIALSKFQPHFFPYPK